MRTVVWSEDARRDYFEILRFIADEDPTAAEKVVDEIERAGNKLGLVSTGRQGRVTGTYEKSLARLPYIIVYSIKAAGAGKEEVSILRIIHTSRNWRDDEWPD